jgi:hypothetical protein
MRKSLSIAALGVHALVTVPAMVAFLAIGPTVDANIGKGLLGIYLLVLGLPWSLPLSLFGSSDGLSALTSDPVLLGAVSLNLAVHAVVVHWRLRKAATKRQATV